ncbi:MAG: beta-ketoacyl-[acyl-carrier-protein] synthase family protein [Phycisphaerales bacterium]
MPSQVVITGIGPACSIGLGIEPFWESLCTATPSIAPIETFDASGYRSGLAGEIREIKIRDFVPKSYRKATKVMARDTELAVIAAKLAADDAGLKTRGSDEGDSGFEITPSRVGCQIGAGLIAADTQELSRAVVSAKDEDGTFSMNKWGTEGEGESGMNNLPPLWLLKYLPNMLACHVTIIHGLEGPSNTIMGAEASAILSIGESTRVIERGSADMCFSGGAESRINPLGLLRWEYTGRLADTKDLSDPSQICKPFDPDSLGGIIGEAGGMLILEDEQHANSRGATPYAKIAGFGCAQSTPAICSACIHPEHAPSGEAAIDRGLEAAIESAIADAKIGPEDIDVIVPMGLGVPELDAQEMGALESIFGDSLGGKSLISLAHLTGNTMAGHGGLMVAAGALCLHKQHIPGHTRTESSDQPIEHVLVCTSSLGGQSGAILLSRCGANDE